MSTASGKLERYYTMLLEDLGSPRFTERLIAEKDRIISMNGPSGATRARSTRLYAIVASTVGSAERKRCRSIEIVSLVTYSSRHGYEKKITFLSYAPLQR